MVVSAKCTKTINVAISKILDFIRSGRLKSQIDPIRAAIAKGDTAQAKALKKDLPAILWSGQFKSRKADDLIQHSGLFVADLDALEDKLQTVRSKLTSSPHLLTLFVSPSGTGLKAVFRVPADPDLHAESFSAAEAHVYQLTGVKIDPSGKDVSRLCFFSFDPDMFINRGVVPELSVPTLEEGIELPRWGCRTDVQTPRLPDVQTHMTHKSLLGGHGWVLEFLPSEVHQTNRLFFDMARKSRSLETTLGRSFTPQELWDTFKTWFNSSRPEFLSETLDNYFEEFCRIRSYVRTPLDESPLRLAWNRAKSQPIPSEALLVREALRSLVAFCAQLQAIAGQSPFFLSSHDAARFLEVDPKQAHRWLRTLEGLEIIHCVKRGDPIRRRASEYRYMQNLQSDGRRIESKPT